MTAFTIGTMINNKVVLVISSKFDHSELIGKHYFGIHGKTKKVFFRNGPPPLKLNTVKPAYKLRLL